ASVFLALVQESLGAGAAHTCVEDQGSAADPGDAARQREQVGRVEVVEDAEREHDVERAVPLGSQVADVAQLEVDLELERTRGEAGLLDVRLSPLDCHYLGAAPCELECVHPLEAGEVE